MKRVRPIRFVQRSLLPLGAACVVANGVREALGSAVAAEAAVRLFPPERPDPRGWHAILRDARIYALRGPSAEAVIILRTEDAAAIAAAAFGENEAASPSLSPLECTALDRVMAILASQFGAICGGVPRIERVTEPGSLATFFELQIERPVTARVGVGLRCDPAPVPDRVLEAEDLADIPIAVRVRMDVGRMPAAALAALEPGDVMPIGSRLGRGLLTAAGRTLALGEVGVSGNRYALEIL